MPNHEPWNTQRAAEIIAAYRTKEGATMPILHEVQETFGYVPEAVIPMIAEAMNLSRAEVHGTFTFYHDFRHEPAGNIFSVCNRCDLPRHVVDALLQLAQIGEQVHKQFAHCRREVIRQVIENQWQVELEQSSALSQCDAVFQAECSHLVDQTSSRADSSGRAPDARLGGRLAPPS